MGVGDFEKANLGASDPFLYQTNKSHLQPSRPEFPSIRIPPNYSPNQAIPRHTLHLSLRSGHYDCA
jgi:hypothetical protein